MDIGAIEGSARQPEGALVSVIIPCYRQAHFLADAILSVLSQTHTRTEVVVVDDGSPDNTAEVASRFGNVIYVRQSNRGLAAARNAGVAHSSGQFLVFLDADDRLTPYAVATGLSAFEARPQCGMVSGHWRYIRFDGSREDEFQQTPLQGEVYLTLLERNYIGMNAAVVHRRSAFEAIGGFDVSLLSCEDYELYMRMSRTFTVFCHDNVVAEYRRYDHSMSKQPSRMVQGVLAVFTAQWPIVKGSAIYLQAFRRGLRRNMRVAYWPAMGVIKRSLLKGDLLTAGRIGAKVLARPMLLVRILMLDLRAASALSRCSKREES